MSGDAHSDAEFRLALNRVYRWYAAGFIAFVLVLALLEQQGLSRQGIGLIFLLATIGLYAGIGIMSRTTDASEYYVAGRRVPAVYNGMATGADWMSAASFISLAGTLYLTGFNGLAFIMGWTGGYCLVAFLLAPYLRRFGQFTIPDFLGERYGGNMPRMLGVLTNKYKTQQLDVPVQALEGARTLAISVENKDRGPRDGKPRQPLLFKGWLVQKAI